jgi:hypothetical protein
MARANRFPTALRRLGGCSLAVTLLIGFGVAQPAPRDRETNRPRDPFSRRLLEIARTYEKYGRVDDEFRWAPFLCRRPNPAAARFSASADAGTHGQKLYSLFARDRNGYLALPKKGQAVGQVIVKQSWVPVSVPDDGKPLRPVVRKVPTSGKKQGAFRHGVEGRDAFLPYARKDGKLFKADRQADLFIMYKTDPSTPGTDRGWVYGTVTADGKEVTSSGSVKSCMKCHQQARHDRMFGLPGQGK